MRPGQNLFLVGPMGVGKTTIGGLLAKKLNKSFIDLDEELERRAGAGIPWIFDVEGEEGFRRREADLLSEYAQKRDYVISTGGGIVLSGKNRQVLHAAGFVVFLDAGIEQLYNRTMKDKRRPLLQVPDRKSVIIQLKQERDPLYREVAHLVFDVGNRSSRAATEALYRKLQQIA